MGSPSRSLILRLNALRRPLIVRGTMTWSNIYWCATSRCEVRYEAGRWFIDGREAMMSDVDRLISKMEKYVQ